MKKAIIYMTRLKNYVVSLASLLVLFGSSLTGQNIYDHAHSSEFAQYLMQTQQYRLASAEWERVLFINPEDTVARLNKVRSLRLNHQPDEAWLQLCRWYPSGPLFDPFAEEALHLTLIKRDFLSFQSVLNRSTALSGQTRSNYELGAWLIEGKWIDRKEQRAKHPFVLTANDPKLLELYTRTILVDRKSPGAAVALSALVPGLGKVYAHDWKDGILSLLFVATNAWQSYRGFSKNGSKSIAGWTFGTLAVGFYSANLFGSWKSARNYNSKQASIITHETEDHLYNH